MFHENLLEPLTPPRYSDKSFTRTLVKDAQSEESTKSKRDSLLTSVHVPESNGFALKEPYTPPESTASARSLIRDLQDENFQVGLVQFINAHNQAEVFYNAVRIDIRCENYNELIHALYDAACPKPGVRWGIARIDVMWEVPLSMTTTESGHYRETPFRGMHGPALRNILRLMNARGWRDLFVVRYIEG